MKIKRINQGMTLIFIGLISVFVFDLLKFQNFAGFFLMVVGLMRLNDYWELDECQKRIHLRLKKK